MPTRIIGANCVVMKQMNEFLIPFAGLKLGKHQFDFQVDKKLFETFGLDEFEDCDVAVALSFEKKSTMLELLFKHKGTVRVPCDVTGEMFDLPVKGKMKLIVQFGDAFNDENEELLILPHGEHQLDVAQYVYEMIALSVPLKRVHPGVTDGTLKSEALERLKSLSVSMPEEKETNEEDHTDPRWDKLKSLLTDK